MKRTLTRIAMGGTFDVLHRGHRVLLAEAFRDGDEFVQIGVTSDAMAAKPRARTVTAFTDRVARLQAFIDQQGWTDRARLVPIDAPEGFALEPEWDTIVVTEETQGNAGRINDARAERGAPPLTVRIAPFALADDGRRLSATRIAAGDVDAEGRFARPPRVVCGSANPVKVDAVRAAFRSVWKDADVTGVAVASKVPEQPVGAPDTWRGARERALAALAANDDADFGVGIEAGLVPRAGPGGWFDVQACCIVDAGGGESWGEGPAFAYPPDVVSRLLGDGLTVQDVLGELAGDPDIGRKQGAVGWLTHGAVDRAQLTAAAVQMALIPRRHPELYGRHRAARGGGPGSAK